MEAGSATTGSSHSSETSRPRRWRCWWRSLKPWRARIGRWAGGIESPVPWRGRRTRTLHESAPLRAGGQECCPESGNSETSQQACGLHAAAPVPPGLRFRAQAGSRGRSGSRPDRSPRKIGAARVPANEANTPGGASNGFGALARQGQHGRAEVETVDATGGIGAEEQERKRPSPSPNKERVAPAVDRAEVMTAASFERSAECQVFEPAIGAGDRVTIHRSRRARAGTRSAMSTVTRSASGERCSRSGVEAKDEERA